MKNEINETARKWWKEHFKNYKESNSFNGQNQAKKTEQEAIYTAFNINVRTHPRLVELGCGAGRTALPFLKKGFELTGIDTSSEALTIFKKRAHKYKLSRKLHTIHNGLYTPITDLKERFDAGYMIVTYQSISNNPEVQKRVFKNFIKLIKPGGKVLILEANPLNLLFYIFFLYIYRGNLREGYNIVNSRKEILTNLLKQTGMTDIKILYYSFLPTFFINYWGFVKDINRFLCSIPVIRNFSAYHIITAVKE